MPSPTHFFKLSLLLSILALALLISGCASPYTIRTPEASAEPVEQGGLPTAAPKPGEEPTATPAASVETSLPAIPEARRLVVEFPPTIRAGDSDTIRLSLEMDENGSLTPTAIIEGHTTSGEPVQIPNLYDTHRVMAVARLDLAGVTISPVGIVEQPLRPGKNVNFVWSVQPPDERASTYRGSIYVSLRFIPINGGEASEEPLSIQPIEFRTTNLLGLSGPPARVVGIAGTVLGSVISLENVIGFVLKRFKGRKKGSKEEEEE